jgi:hypothetical protein
MENNQENHLKDEQLQTSALSEPPIEEHHEPRKKHSGLGIASFIIAILAIIATVILFTSLSGILTENDILTNVDFEDQAAAEQYLQDVFQSNPELLAIFMGFIVVFVMTVIGGILGIIGLFVKDRKKIFPILGTIFNCLPVLILMILMSLGALV